MNDRGNQLKPEAKGDRLKTPVWTWLKGLGAGLFFLGHLLVLTPLPASAVGSVTLAWNRSTSSNVTGYYVYYGGTSGIYPTRLYAGSTTNLTLPNLVAGRTYYFAVTSYDTDGVESLFSNEETYSIPKMTPVSQRPARQIPTRPVARPVARPVTRLVTHLVPATASAPPLVLVSPVISGGRFSFSVPGVAGSKYAVEASINLATWVRVVTNRAPFTFMETNAGQPGKRFFRAVRLP